MNKTGVIVGVVALLVIGGGAYALAQNSDAPKEATSSSDHSDEEGEAEHGHDDETTTSGNEQASNTISYTDDGFSPSTLTVKAGTVITVKNNSSRPLQFSSDPHPAHTDEDELNLSTLSPGKTSTFTAGNAGSYGFHDHLNEEATGTLRVE